MASILDRYGIKEVCDVTFYDLDANGMPYNPALFLDTLKVSTIEQTAEEATAQGGKGNTPLIVWDYGKEITVTLEDALFSAKSMAMMFGNGKAGTYSSYLMKTETFIATADASAASAGWNASYKANNGMQYSKINPKFYNADGTSLSAATELSKGQTYFCTYDVQVTNCNVIEISANSFPGTYYVCGDTYARSEVSGKDEFFQFIIPKAKIQSENTITLEADGDPSVFNMTLRVLRPRDGIMMKLVKYDISNGTPIAGDAINIVHNHALNPQTT